MGQKWPVSSWCLSLFAAIVPEKEKVYSRQVSAPILKRKTSRFGLGQLLTSGTNHNCATSVVTTSSSSSLHPPNTSTSTSTTHNTHHLRVNCNSQNIGTALSAGSITTTPVSPRPRASFLDSISSHLHYYPASPLPSPHSPSPSLFMITQPGSTTNLASCSEHSARLRSGSTGGAAPGKCRSHQRKTSPSPPPTNQTP